MLDLVDTIVRYIAAILLGASVLMLIVISNNLGKF